MDTLVKLRERRSVAVDTTEGGKPDKAAVNAVKHTAQDRELRTLFAVRGDVVVVEFKNQCYYS